MGGTLPLGFIGADFLCEEPADSDNGGRVYDAVDALWDGATIFDTQCVDAAESAPSFQTAPRALSVDDVELRLQGTEGSANEDVSVTRIELWVR